jgi:hypothetical protein
MADETDIRGRSVEVLVDEAFLKDFGEKSLVKKLTKDFQPLPIPTKVVLIFPRTTRQWRQEHKGASNWMVHEESIPYLLADISELVYRGHAIAIVHINKDP